MSRCTTTAASAGRCSTPRRSSRRVPESLRDEVAELGRILGYTPHHTSRPTILPLDVPDRGLTPAALLHHLQRATSWPPAASPARAPRSSSSRSTASTRPTSTRSPPRTGCRSSPRPWWAGSRAKPHGETTMDLEVAHADRARRAEGRRQRASDGGGRRRLREDRADARGRGPAVSRRGVELLDRLGLRQADHRSRSGAGAVGAGDRALARHDGVQRQRRPRRAGVQGRRGLVVPAGCQPTSGWTRSRRCPR